MVKQYKVDEVSSFVDKLGEKGNLFFTDFSGVDVKNITILRRKLREKNAEYRVVKNTLFKRALEKAGYSGLDEYIKGPLGVAFVKDEIGEVARVLKDFKSEEENFSFSIGYIENTLYNESEVEKIASLPSREVVLSQTMSMINAPATQIATGMKQIMSSLARGIKAVAEAHGNQ
jgi:large subunit ribosomal protein L10